MPTLVPLLRAAIASANQRRELLVLLSIFAGLLTSLIYTPAIIAIKVITAETSSMETTETDLNALSDLIGLHIPTLAIAYLGQLAVSGFLLPFWARAQNPDNLLPWDGSRDSILRQGWYSYQLLVTSTLYTIAGFIVIALVAVILASISGAITGFVLILAIIAAIWISIFFSAAANTGIIAASIDIKLNLTEAIKRNRFFLRPIVGSLAVILFANIILNAASEPFIDSLFEGDIAARFIAFTSGTLGYLTSALHISALYKIPGIHQVDTRP